MPFKRRDLLLGGGAAQYLLYDAFTDTLAAGAVNGTRSTPPEGVQIVGAVPIRTVTDTNSLISLASGVVTVSGSPVANDGWAYANAPVTRVSGKLLLVDMPAVVTSQNANGVLGFSRTAFTNGTPAAGFQPINATTTAIKENNVVGPTLTLGAAPWKFAIGLRPSGAYFYFKSGGNWLMMWIAGGDGTATVYPINKLASNAINSQFDNYRIPVGGYIPIPLLSDSFARTDPRGARTVVDTNGKLSIAGGVASFATGGIGVNNPGLQYAATSLIAGKAMLAQINVSTKGDYFEVGFNIFTATATDVIFGVSNIVDRSGLVTLGAYSTGVLYSVAAILRSVGGYIFIKGGAFTNWSLLWEDLTGNPASPQPGFGGASLTVGTVTNVRVPIATFLPVPLLYDTFTRANGALGNSEIVGPDGQAAPALAWTGATWAISGNAIVNTPNVGADVAVNGTFTTNSDWTGALWAIAGGVVHASAATVNLTPSTPWIVTGQWYRTKLTVLNYVSGQVGFRLGAPATHPAKSGNGTFTETARAMGTICSISALGTNFTGDVDDVIVQPLTLSKLFSSVTISPTDGMFDVVVKTYSGGRQAGLVARLNSAATPTSGLVAYFDNVGSNPVKLDEFTAELTWNNLLNVNKAFNTGDTLRLDLSGAAWRLYHITAAGAVTLLGSGTTAVLTGNLCGAFSTDPTNVIDAIQVMPKTDAAYDTALNAMSTAVLADCLLFDDFTIARQAGTLNGSSDVPIGTSDGAGHAEANGGAGKVWNGTNWIASGGEAMSQPGLGADIVTDGDFATDPGPWNKGAGWTIAGGVLVGTAVASGSTFQSGGVNHSWYQFQYTILNYASGSISAYKTTTVLAGRGANGTFIDTGRLDVNTRLGVSVITAFTGQVDNFSAKLLTLADLFASTDLGVLDTLYDATVKTLAASTQAGLVARLDSAVTPANFLIAYFDGGGMVKLDEVVAGVYTNLLGVSKAFTTGDTLRLDLSGSAYRLYHITSGGTVTLIGNGTTNVVTGTRYGLFNTWGGNQVEGVVNFPKGSNGEYAALDAL
jgi:hypothetical protein